ncbi:MAG: M20/M25/M40 family metallo-hydrolase [Elusimicrobiaceae bacterium]|nr:M20/M25/M40 family metallo-hydrolase [Elusimicrobiaceae bacterium]
MQVNHQRMLKNFLEITKIYAPSGEEKAMLDHAKKELTKLGCKVYIDKAGKTFGSTAQGNLTANFKGNIKSAPFILGGHLDTVRPCKGVKPSVKNGKVITDGKTILGADDRAGLAMIFEILRTLKENKVKHPPVDIILTLCEEGGMYGSKYLDTKIIKGKEGLLLDSESNEELVVNAPKAVLFYATIKGVASHAGVAPEKGINALQVAAKAISMMRLGRIDPMTISNIGVVNGGQSTNVVMPELTLKGEVRSRTKGHLEKELKHIEDCFKKAAKMFVKKVDGKTIKPEIIWSTELKYPLLDIAPKSALITHIKNCGKKFGLNIKTASSGGGFDANVLAGKGLFMPIIGVGYADEHTTKESLDIETFFKTADLVLDIVLNYKK